MGGEQGWEGTNKFSRGCSAQSLPPLSVYIEYASLPPAIRQCLDFAMIQLPSDQCCSASRIWFQSKLTADMSAVWHSSTADMSHSKHVCRGMPWHTADHSRHVCCVTQQTRLLCHIVSHSRRVCCVPQHPTADVSAMSNRFKQQTCLLCHTADMS